MKNLRLVCLLPNGDERKVLVAASDFQSVQSVAAEKLGADGVVIQIKVDDDVADGGSSGGDLWEVDQSFWPSLSAGQTLYAQLSSQSPKRKRGRPSKERGTINDVSLESGASAGEEIAAVPRTPPRRSRQRGKQSTSSADRRQTRDRRQTQSQAKTGEASSLIHADKSSNGRRNSTAPRRAATSVTSAEGASSLVKRPTATSQSRPAAVSAIPIVAPTPSRPTDVSVVADPHQSSGPSDGWDSLMAPVPRSSGKAWSARDDAFLWTSFKNGLKHVEKRPLNHTERVKFFERLLEDHGSGGRIDTTLAGRTAKSLETRIRAKIRTAMEKNETIPPAILNFFGMLRSSPSRSSREASMSLTRRSGSSSSQPAGGRPRRTYVVVDDDDESHSSGSEPEELRDLSPAPSVASRAATSAASSPRPVRRRVAENSTMVPGPLLSSPSQNVATVGESTSTVSSTFSSLANARVVQERQAALNPFAPRTQSGAAGSTAASAESPGPPHEPLHSNRETAGTTIKTEAGSSEDELMEAKPSTSQATVAATTATALLAPLRFKLQPESHLDSSTSWQVAEGSNQQDIQLLRMALSPQFQRLRESVRVTIVRHVPERFSVIEELGYAATMHQMCRVLDREIAAICRQGREVTSALYTQACSAVAVAALKAVFEQVAPPDWSIRRVCFAVAGYFAALQATHTNDNPTNSKELLIETAMRTFWALRAANAGDRLDINQEESEDICAAMTLALGQQSLLESLVQEQLVASAGSLDVGAALRKLAKRLEDLLLKLEASMLFLGRCRFPIECWGAQSVLRQSKSSALHPDQLQIAFAAAYQTGPGGAVEAQARRDLDQYRILYRRLVQERKIALS